MDSSDDEAGTLPELVSNYYFLDHADEPTSFSVLPVMWSEHDSPDDSSDGVEGGVFLHGSLDEGLRKMYKEVLAWKIDLNNVSPEISVLSKEKKWFKLQKPRKSYEDTIRSVLITVNCLHYLKRNPESSAKSLWDHMAKVFRLYEVKPSANDLANHTSLISEVTERDDSLGKCKFLTTFLKEKPRARKPSSEGVKSARKSDFIVEDDAMEVPEDDSDAEEEDDVFDSVCAICDNGGELLCCEGRCMRSFHATTESGEDSICESLGLTDAEVEAIQQFLCKNCTYKQHQCFVCGKLGSSDKSSGAEVFACVSATCGRFYHPNCVAKLLHPKDQDAAKKLQKDIAEGKSFTCPSHKCHICGKGEKKMMPPLQFAVCRRCPRSYHRKCVPEGIAFEDSEDRGLITRAWEGLLPNRILIYCLKHAIDKKLGTPARNHVKFPHVEEKKTATSVKRKNPTTALLSSTENRMAEKKKSPAPNEYSNRASPEASDQKERLSSLANKTVKRKKVNASAEQEIPKKAKVRNVSVQSQKELKKVGGNSSTVKQKEDNVPLGERLFAYYMEGADSEQQVQPEKQDGTVASKAPSKKLDTSLPTLDADSERRMQSLIKEATSSVSMQDVLDKHKLPSTTHTHSLKSSVDKAITMGKVEGSVEAVRTALQKIEEGGSIEDAQAVCDPGVLSQLFKWKDRLNVYLSPFIFGMRYTSFGRHFTKVDKLRQIVDKLHWYVQNGDTIVDFCCGANDFSCLLAKKLEETGKKCSYKNYDLFPAKNTFNFEKRDWMTVNPKELPPGKKLIMGLNPPFGIKAALANKFIDKALSFKPKLLILIVPPETQRLDTKKFAYDLVWEDDHFLSGKSFYLPGSVDENDKQMDQWNLNAPVLYLWSRPAWTSRHKAIAQKQGHLVEESNEKIPNGVPSVSEDEIRGQSGQGEETNESPSMTEFRNGGFSPSHDREEDPENGNNQPHNGSRKKPLDKRPKEISRPSSREPDLSSLHTHSRRSSDMSMDSDIKGTNNQPHVESLHPESDVDYASVLDDIVEDIGRTYGLNNVEYPPRERLSNSLSPHLEYRAPNLEEFPRGNPIERAGDYGSSSIIEADEIYWRDMNNRTQVRLYGRQNSDPTQRTSYPAVHDLPYPQPWQASSSTYGLGAPLPAEPSYRMNTSTIQRYAPRLDELNPSRMVGGRLAPEPLSMIMPGIYDERAPQPGIYDQRAPPHAAGYPGNPQGFASGPYCPFSSTNSSGWLNE